MEFKDFDQILQLQVMKRKDTCIVDKDVERMLVLPQAPPCRRSKLSDTGKVSQVQPAALAAARQAPLPQLQPGFLAAASTCQMHSTLRPSYVCIDQCLMVEQDHLS